RYGLPEPVRQFNAGSDDEWLGRVDLAYPDDLLLLEVQSDLHHTSKVAVADDNLRIARLTAAGWRVLPIGSGLIRFRPEVFAQLVAQSLGLPPPAELLVNP